ncbi:lysM domain receptor-like kinase 4 [Diospyros lotus]|uniref:lysM domain receptor-like kinase 4 n=1 Tax=Diospyros lotus TaxID=55363 RepID=UPI0022578183|nr:lysM domain receptor-like kinase 4 [Diospyros lotus]
MIFPWFLIWVELVSLNAAWQFYDATLCSSDTDNPGRRYACNSFQKSCQTFVVYRAGQQFQTISNISGLFRMEPDVLLPLNNLTSPSEILEPAREVLVPVNCSCTGQFFQASVRYLVAENTTRTEIACGAFEGLLKPITLAEENPSRENSSKVGSVLDVPLKCACPDEFTSSNGVSYLVTYPIVLGDFVNKLGEKFGISPQDILEANHLDPTSAIYPNTTVLIPIKGKVAINFDLPDSDPPAPGFLPTVPVEKIKKRANLKILYVTVSIVGFSVLLIAVLGCCFYVKAFNIWRADRIQSSARRSVLTPCSTPRTSSPRSGQTTRSSTNSCLSPDLLAGIKYSFCSYNIEELRSATKDFSKEAKITSCVYKGLVDNVEVMIKRVRFEDTRSVIDVHSKINHINIVKLLGVCYGENDFSWSYIVLESPANGCLRDCLSNSSSSLRWHRRTQVAFDIATVLHYLHRCMIPPCTHMSITSRNIFMTQNWRAKLAVFGNSLAAGSSKENENKGSPVGGWVAPEHLENGLAYEKVDIFAFGVVLLELISGIDTIQGKLLEDSIGFLGGGAGEGGCFEQLRNFMDPSLKEGYPLAEALCLAVLAKACVEDNPLHRPSIDDIMKVLARMNEQP